MVEGDPGGGPPGRMNRALPVGRSQRSQVGSMCPPVHDDHPRCHAPPCATSHTRRPTKSQPCSLLSMPRLNNSRALRANCRRIRIAQISFSFSGALARSAYLCSRECAVSAYADIHPYGSCVTRGAIILDRRERPEADIQVRSQWALWALESIEIRKIARRNLCSYRIDCLVRFGLRRTSGGSIVFNRGAA